VIIYNFHVLDSSLRPNETDAVFVIDADGMLASSVALQGFKPVAGRSAEIVECPCDVELLEFPQSDPLDVRRQIRRFVALMNPFGCLAAKGNNHLPYIDTLVDSNVKRHYLNPSGNFTGSDWNGA
jgi:hypothetical protein